MKCQNSIMTLPIFPYVSPSDFLRGYGSLETRIASVIQVKLMSRRCGTTRLYLRYIVVQHGLEQDCGMRRVQTQQPALSLLALAAKRNPSCYFIFFTSLSFRRSTILCSSRFPFLFFLILLQVLQEARASSQRPSLRGFFIRRNRSSRDTRWLCVREGQRQSIRDSDGPPWALASLSPKSLWVWYYRYTREDSLQYVYGTRWCFFLLSFFDSFYFTSPSLSGTQDKPPSQLDREENFVRFSSEKKAGEEKREDCAQREVHVRRTNDWSQHHEGVMFYLVRKDVEKSSLTLYFRFFADACLNNLEMSREEKKSFSTAPSILAVFVLQLIPFRGKNQQETTLQLWIIRVRNGEGTGRIIMIQPP